LNENDSVRIEFRPPFIVNRRRRFKEYGKLPSKAGMIWGSQGAIIDMFGQVCLICPRNPLLTGKPHQDRKPQLMKGCCSRILVMASMPATTAKKKEKARSR